MKRVAQLYVLPAGIAIVWLCSKLSSPPSKMGTRPALGRADMRLSYAGKPITYWEKQAILEMQRGDFEKVILPVVQKMGSKAVPFWLDRLQTKDSKAALLYAKLCVGLPTALMALVPQPIVPGSRRAVACMILDVLQYTNGMPELIQMSYSKDTELKRDAVLLLWTRAYRCCEPSSECISAFCSALEAADRQTRLYAVLGLNVLPVRSQARPALQLALKDIDEEIRVNAAVAISKLDPGSNLAYIFESGMTSANSNVRAISSVQLSNLQRR
jgi:hypothetical protein